MSILTNEEIDRKFKQTEITLLELEVEKKRLELEKFEEDLKSGRLKYYD